LDLGGFPNVVPADCLQQDFVIDLRAIYFPGFIKKFIQTVQDGKYVGFVVEGVCTDRHPGDGFKTGVVSRPGNPQFAV